MFRVCCAELCIDATAAPRDKAASDDVMMCGRVMDIQ